MAATIPYSKVEVSTKSGRIDILTPSEVIEVKQVTKYKHAIGQVTSYGYYYPRHQKRIHLYGQVSLKQRRLIILESVAANILATFEK